MQTLNTIDLVLYIDCDIAERAEADACRYVVMALKDKVSDGLKVKAAITRYHKAPDALNILIYESSGKVLCTIPYASIDNIEALDVIVANRRMLHNFVYIKIVVKGIPLQYIKAGNARQVLGQ